MQNKEWVIDGNYSHYLQNERLREADRIIIFGFNRFSCLIRAIKRYNKYKNTTRESMAEGCREKLDAEFIKWILHDGRTRKKRAAYRQIYTEYKDKTVILRSQRQLDEYKKAQGLSDSAPC